MSTYDFVNRRPRVQSSSPAPKRGDRSTRVCHVGEANCPGLLAYAAALALRVDMGELAMSDASALFAAEVSK